MARLTACAALAAVLLTSCAAAGSPGSPAPRDRSNVIELSELGTAELPSIYELVRNHRPDWLTQRGVLTFGNDDGILVYLDQARLGGIESMRHIHPQSVTRVTFLDARQASYRFGPGHLHGAIVISTQLEN